MDDLFALILGIMAVNYFYDHILEKKSNWDMYPGPYDHILYGEDDK